MKHGQCPKDLNLSSIDHSLIHLFTFFKNEKNLELSSSPPVLLYIYSLVTQMSCDLKNIFKYEPCKLTDGSGIFIFKR